MDKPKFKLSSLDFTEVVEVCRQMIDAVEAGEYHPDDDWSGFIVEKALKAVYGNKVFEYIATWEVKNHLLNDCKDGVHTYKGINNRCIWCDYYKGDK